MKFSVATAPSGAKVAEASQDLERLLLRLEEGGRVGADAAERVGPLGARRAHRVEAKCRRVEEDALALHLFDDGALGEHVLERVTAGQPAEAKVEAAQLRERMVLVEDRCADPVLGAEVAHEDRDDERVGLVAGHLHEAGGAETRTDLVAEVAEELHLEKPARLGARDPRATAAPRADAGERVELFVDALEAMLRQAVEPVVEDPRHLPCKPTRLSLKVRGRAPLTAPRASPPPARAAP